MDVFKKNLEKIVLTLALLLLAGTAFALYLKAAKIAAELVHGKAAREVEAISVRADDYKGVFERFANPPTWRLSDHQVFTPPKMYLKDGVVVIEAPEGDRNRNGVADAWETRFGISIETPQEIEKDFDDDWFTNREEYLLGTDPTDPQSRRSYALKLLKRRVEVEPINVRFLGAIRLQGQEKPTLLFEIRKTGEQLTVSENGTVDNYQILEATRAPNQDIDGVWVETLKGRKQKIYLPQGKWVEGSEPMAVLWVVPEKRELEVYPGDKFMLRGEEFLVKSVDIKSQKVIITDSAGENHEIPHQR